MEKVPATHTTFKATGATAQRGPFALPTFSPRRVSLYVGIAYLIVGSSYIAASGYMAARYAEDILQLKHIEMYKGIAFMLVSSTAICAGLHWLLRRIAHKERICAHQREALILSENRALAGVFASSVAHDINNVLTILDYTIEQLASGAHNPEEREAQLKELQQTSERLKGLTDRLASVVRGQPNEEFEHMDIVNVIGETVDMARTHERVRIHPLKLELDTDAKLHMDGNSVLVHQMLLNLIINAADASPAAGRIQVKTYQDNGNCVIEVHDNGPGVLEADRKAIFTPFYTTKEKGKGLGLLSVKACADAHHGSVEVTGSPLGGACFRICLPLNPDGATQAA